MTANILDGPQADLKTRPISSPGYKHKRASRARSAGQSWLQAGLAELSAWAAGEAAVGLFAHLRYAVIPQR